METLASALQLIKPNCYLAILDLKDAYYSVPIFIEHRKFLKFKFEGSRYEFKLALGNLHSHMSLSEMVLKDLDWWINCSNRDPQQILPHIPHCDISLLGWGGGVSLMGPQLLLVVDGPWLSQ